ncbi:putative (E)-beta-ocimene synthase [Helianthus annuus]|nr:putative (E)-beta-ocimene synthase [Helianthus annuus]
MECFFWSVGMVFEPQYYSCRLGLTKVGALITTIDDIYDVYGSIDELKIFTDAVKRWDINAMKHMSEVLQVGFLALYNTINDMGYDTLVAQGTNIIPILAKVVSIQELIKETHSLIAYYNSYLFPYT